MAINIETLRFEVQLNKLDNSQMVLSPLVVGELLDRLEEAEKACKISDQTVYDLTEKVIPNIQEKLEAAEKERDGLRHCFNEWIDKTEWVQRGINEGTISPKYLGLHRADIIASLLGATEKERDASELMSLALRAKVKQMEKQEPVATVRINAINGNPSVDFVPGHRYLHHNDKLYLAPGAQGE